MTVTYESSFACYAAIGRRIAEAIPEPWVRIVVLFEISDIDNASKGHIDYIPRQDPSATRHVNIIDAEFSACFYQLARLISAPTQDCFKRCRFTLGADGQYQARYEY